MKMLDITNEKQSPVIPNLNPQPLIFLMRNVTLSIPIRWHFPISPFSSIEMCGIATKTYLSSLQMMKSQFSLTNEYFTIFPTY
jgi:hypothetical protein